MTESYYAATYWPGRMEPLESYAQRAERLFRGLTVCDPVLTRWFEQARSRKAALKSQIVPDAEMLLKNFKTKKHQLHPGWISFFAWNGEGADNTVVNFSCGSDSPYVVDCCVLTPPLRGQAAERILSASVLTQILRVMVEAWEPDIGIATSHTHRDEVLKIDADDTFVGWIMYFSKDRGTIPPLPEPVRVEPVEDKGTLVILTPERFTASNPEHVALAAQVQDILGQAGLLKPVKVLP